MILNHSIFIYFVTVFLDLKVSANKKHRLFILSDKYNVVYSCVYEMYTLDPDDGIMCRQRSHL